MSRSPASTRRTGFSSGFRLRFLSVPANPQKTMAKKDEPKGKKRPVRPFGKRPKIAQPSFWVAVTRREPWALRKLMGE
jgi:hypothetical protein